MVDWEARVYDLNSGTARLVGAPFMHWNMKFGLNGTGGVVEADMHLKHPDVTYDNFKPAARELRIYRDEGSGDTLTWGGYIWIARVSRKTQMVRIVAKEYYSRLYRRILHDGLKKEDTDTGVIAWDLINWTQNNDGTLGITDSHITSGFVVDRYFCKADKVRVAEAIDELSQMDNSFDFWITPTITNNSNKVYHTAGPGTNNRRGSDLSGTITLNAANLIEDDYEIDASSMANRVWGEGTGDCNPPSFEAASSQSITDYGELEDTIDFEDLDHYPSIKAHTREWLRNNKKPREMPTWTLREGKGYTWGDFDIGDIIKVNRPTGFDSGDHLYRVVTFEADFVPGNKIAFYRIGGDSVID